MKFLIPVLAAVLPLAAQDIKMPANLDKLAAKASEVVDISLDGGLLKLASGFLSDKDADEANVKRLVGGLKGIYVKSFEFEEKGEYKDSDLDEMRVQLRGPGWSHIVGTRSKRDHENADVFIKTEGGQIGGLVVLVMDPKELTIISLIGSIRPEDLRDLGGHMGIPKIDIGPSKNDRRDKDKKEDEK